MSQVFLYDSKTIDSFQWPDTEDGRKGKDYLYPLIKEGVEPYLQNVTTKFYLLSCNQIFLPISVNEKEYENSYVASNYYALQFYQEKFSQKNPFLLKIQKPLLYLGEQFLKAFKINKTIFLNNWLMTNSLSPEISGEEMQAITDFLKKEFPDHTLIFRHVDGWMKKNLLNSLRDSRFHLLKTRDVFFYGPISSTSGDRAQSKIYRKDMRLIEKHGYEIIRNEELKESDLGRLLSLYEMLYVQKYTKYSPRYTEKFLQNIHQKKVINFIALKRNGVIEGFFAYFIFNRTMINCLFGYDTSLPHAHDIYRLLTRLVLEEATNRGVTINDGSGGEQAKLNRGLLPHAEYMGLYSAHLPLPRRLLWDGIAYFYKKLTPKSSQE